MVNPRWRPELANSRIPDGKHNKKIEKLLFSIPEPEEYIGSYIKGDFRRRKSIKPKLQEIL